MLFQSFTDPRPVFQASCSWMRMMSQEVLGSCVSLEQGKKRFWIARKSNAPVANAARTKSTSVTTILKVGQLPAVGTVVLLLVHCSIATCSSFHNFLTKCFSSLLLAVTIQLRTWVSPHFLFADVPRCLAFVECVVIVRSHALDLPFLRPFLDPWL